MNKLTYKNADPLIHGAVKRLACVTKVDKLPHHEEQYYYIFWVSHINQIHISGGLNKKQVLEWFKISEERFDEVFEKDEFICKKCLKRSDQAFNNLINNGLKICYNCFQ